MVAEVYGPVFQGEGPSTGVRCSFIRFGGCNLTCGWRRSQTGLEAVTGAWQCDEPQTWNTARFDLRATLTRSPAADVAARALACKPPLVVITGGEPLLHQDHPGWGELLLTILQAGARIEIETNGTLMPGLLSRQVEYRVSPKLASSGLPEAARLVPPVLEWHARWPGSVFKFVVMTRADVEEAARVAETAGMPPARVWIMPEGITGDRVLAVARDVAPAVTSHRFNLTLRQHVLIYGTEREPRDE